jgi:uncharacterized protein (DUF608 family)
MLVALSCNQGQLTSGDGHKYNGSYSGDNLNHIAFPVGGLGAGMICIEGTGAVSHVSVWNQPDVFNEPAMFSAISVKGLENGAKVLEGPVPDHKIFGRPRSARGAPGATYGLPRFDNAVFTARFPFATVELRDDDIPLEISIQAWSPFIPLDPDNSSIPCGAFEYTFTNRGNTTMEAVYSFNSVNFMSQPECRNLIKPYSNGFILSSLPTDEKPQALGDFAFFTDDNSTIVNHCWFRGSWWDPLTMAWKHVAEADPVATDPVEENAPGASLYVPFTLKPGETRTIRLMMAWYVPNTTIRTGEEVKTPQPACDGTAGCCDTKYHRPWYASRFKSVNALAGYWSWNYDDLKEGSKLFSEALYNSTLPDEVNEAVTANLTILKSPTVLRQYDGRLWAWEGCNDQSGCCSGSCTHVWNYAQAISHLFPSLERSLRETEFLVSQDASGHQTFRSALPIRPVGHSFHAAADGQLGGIMKVYREWRISGDNEWLRKMYPYLKQNIDYCINLWDPREHGVLEEPHHNTYDVEFWGPDGMCTSFYLGALKAFTAIGEFLGEDVSRYSALLDRGVKTIETDLYDGEYFFQKIQVDGLSSPSPLELAQNSIRTGYSGEARELLLKEGPKYQYGKGCLSDGIIGMWMAKVCGINEEIIDDEKVESHLVAVHKYNYKADLSNHANPQRPTYAMKHEGGLLLCTWPKGGALSLPFVYSNEVWTGIEYQVAAHLMFFGQNDKGLDIVKACRDRYDGRIRNPFDEYECGHWYARAMSSYSMIQALTGITYDAVTKTLYIDSKVGDDFDSFFSCQSGWGNAGMEKGKPYVRMARGTIDVEKCVVAGEDFPVAELIMQ